MLLAVGRSDRSWPVQRLSIQEQPVIERFEGYVARYVGDGILAYFGFPQAHEDDAERAVRAGLDVVESVGRLRSEVTRNHGYCPTVRIGIATGPVVVGDIVGEGAAQQSTVLGETPNLAARLQGLATPNAIVISPATRELLGEFFSYRNLGPQEIKGLEKPVNAWKVLAARSPANRFEASQRRRLTPLVGRDEELEILERRWRRVKASEGQVVLISGDAGIGKSRLAQTLATHVRDQQCEVLHCQCSPYHANSAFYPIITYLEHAAGIERGDSDAERLDKLERLLEQPSVNGETVVPVFASLLSIDTEERYPPIQLEAGQLKDRILTVLVEQLFGLSNERPLLLVFEDVHWIDRTSLELLDLMIDPIRRRRVLVLITHRPGFEVGWLGEAHVTSLALSKLRPSSVESLVANFIGGKDLPKGLLDEIVNKTDGVPLFVEELTRAILDLDVLEETDHGYRLSGPLPERAIPSTLHDSLMARLDRLSEVKDIAQTAAVIGREFSRELMLQITDLKEDTLDDALSKLIDAGLILRRGAQSSANYVFKHALIRDTAYESLLISRRRYLHNRIAKVIESDFPEELRTKPEILGHHYTEAEEYKRAIDYWLMAARRAVEQSALYEADAHAYRGLSLVDKLPSQKERDRMELKLLMSVSRSLQATTGWGSKEQVRVVARARELAQRLHETEPLIEVLQKERVRHWIRAEYDQAKELARQTVELAQREGIEIERIVSNYSRGWPALAQGELDEVSAVVSETFSFYNEERHSSHRFSYGIDIQVATYCMYGYERWLRGSSDEAERAVSKGLVIAHEIDHIPTLAWSLTWAGAQPAAMHRDVNGVMSFTEQLLALPEKKSSPMDRAWAELYRGWAIGRCGQLVEGIALANKAIEFLDGGEYKLFRGIHLALLAELYLEIQEYENTERLLEAAESHCKLTGERLWQPEVIALQGELAAASGDPNEANALFDEAIRAAESCGFTALSQRTAGHRERVLIRVK